MRPWEASPTRRVMIPPPGQEVKLPEGMYGPISFAIVSLHSEAAIVSGHLVLLLSGPLGASLLSGSLLSLVYCLPALLCSYLRTTLLSTFIGTTLLSSVV